MLLKVQADVRRVLLEFAFRFDAHVIIAGRSGLRGQLQAPERTTDLELRGKNRSSSFSVDCMPPIMPPIGEYTFCVQKLFNKLRNVYVKNVTLYQSFCRNYR